MAAYSGERYENSSAQGVEYFQYNHTPQNIRDSSNILVKAKADPEIKANFINANDNFEFNFHYIDGRQKSDVREDQGINEKAIYANLHHIDAKSAQVARPKFSVGGLVSTNYHSNPNLSGPTNDQEESSAKLINQSNSYTVYDHSRSIDEQHRVRDEINQTNLACLIQGALGKGCDVIQVDQTCSENNIQSRRCSNSLNGATFSVGRQLCNPLVGGVVGSNNSNHQGGPSTILVMMNNNPTNINPSSNRINQPCSPNQKKHDQPLPQKCLEKTNMASRNSTKHITPMAIRDQQNGVTQSSMSAPYYGIPEADETSEGGFKSSFAQEVAQNVRNSSSLTRYSKQKRRNGFFDGKEIENDYTDDQMQSSVPYSDHPSISPNIYNLNGKINRDEAASLTSGFFDTSIDFCQDEFSNEDARSPNQIFEQIIKSPSLVDPTDDCPSSSLGNTWMTSKEFVQLLEKQEAAENGVDVHHVPKGFSLGRDKKIEKRNLHMKQRINKAEQERLANMFGGTDVKCINNGNNGDKSYLDQEAQFPFGKLKKTCTDLGFTFSEQEWSQLGKMLSMDKKVMNPSFSENNSITHTEIIDKNYKANIANVANCANHAMETKPGGEPQDVTVKNGDFFAALHMLMKNKHNYLHNSSRQPEDHHKYSMKSDSGGEMESCRSSDSENLNDMSPSSPIGPHKMGKNNQFSQRSSLCFEESTARNERASIPNNSSSLNIANPNSRHSIDLLAEQLAERDTELLRTRLECQRLNQIVSKSVPRGDRLYDLGPKTQQQQQRKKNLQLEKEVEHLKWQLEAMESSRKTYEQATNRLVTFLEQVTTVLQGTSPVQRKMLESTRAEVSKVARRARIQGSQAYLQRGKRFSIDSTSQNSAISRAESLPGLNSGFGGSLLSLSTSTTEASSANGGYSPNTSSSSKQSSRKHRNDKYPRDAVSVTGSISSRNSSNYSNGHSHFEKSGYKTLPSQHHSSSSNFRSTSLEKPKQRIKRSQSTSSGGGNAVVNTRHHSLSSRTQSPMPSLQECPVLYEENTYTAKFNPRKPRTSESRFKDQDSRRSLTLGEYVNNEQIHEFVKSCSLKRAPKESLTSQSQSGLYDQRQINLESNSNDVQERDKLIIGIENQQSGTKHFSDPKDSSKLNNKAEFSEPNEHNKSHNRMKAQNQLKQVIKIGGSKKDASTCKLEEDEERLLSKSNADDKEFCGASGNSNIDTNSNTNQINKSRKYVPRRSASAASMSKGLKPPLDKIEDANEEHFQGQNCDSMMEKSHHVTKISGRFSLGSGVARARGRKASRSSSRSKDKSVSPPPPMPIDAVVQVVSPTFSVEREDSEFDVHAVKGLELDGKEQNTMSPSCAIIQDSLCKSIDIGNLLEQSNGALPAKASTSSIVHIKDTSSITRQTNVSQSKNPSIQVLLSSNSNNPAALRTEVRSGTYLEPVALLKDQTKFKSLGDLHMEKGLPPVPRVLNSPMPETKDNDFEGSSAYNSSSSSVVRDRLANNAHKLLRSMKQLLAREKTINITGSGSSNCQSQIAGHGNKNGVVITSSRSTTNNGSSHKSHLTSIASNGNKSINSKIQAGKESAESPCLETKSSNKSTDSNITKVNINNTNVPHEPQELDGHQQNQQMQTMPAFPFEPRVNLQLLSTTSFPGLPSYPVLAASRSSPWNC